MNGDKCVTKKLHVESPLIENLTMKQWSNGRPVYLKLDNNQPGGSFKIRGIGAACQQAKKEGYEEIVCPSGGNAGIASAYAARQLGLKATIVVFNITSDKVADRIKQEGATLVRHGNSSDETIEHAKFLASDVTKKRKFIHPFDMAIVWEGHSSIVDEIYRELNGEQPSLIVTCCGGGGLFCGLMKGLEKYNWKSTGVLVMETDGSGSFNAMVKNNYQIVPIKCSTKAKTLASIDVCQVAANYASNSSFNVFSELVSDVQAMEACLLLADQQKILVELSCGTVMSALYTGIVRDILANQPNLPPKGPIIMIVCGGNDVSLETISEWQKEVKLAKTSI